MKNYTYTIGLTIRSIGAANFIAVPLMNEYKRFLDPES